MRRCILLPEQLVDKRFIDPVIDVIKVRVAALLIAIVDACFFRQFPYTQLGIVQHVEIHFGAALASFADGVHRMRRAGKQNIRHDVGQLARFFFFEPALGDPWCAQADAGGIA